MKDYIFIGRNKMPLNTNYKKKCPYLNNLHRKDIDIKKKIKIKKEEIILEKLNNEIYQRDYSFFSQNKPGLVETIKLPKIYLLSQFKYSISSPEEKYSVQKLEKEDQFAKIYKNKALYFPRAVKKYLSNNKNKKNKSESFLYLPLLHSN